MRTSIFFYHPVRVVFSPDTIIGDHLGVTTHDGNKVISIPSGHRLTMEGNNLSCKRLVSGHGLARGCGVVDIPSQNWTLPVDYLLEIWCSVVRPREIIAWDRRVLSPVWQSGDRKVTE